MLIDIIRKEYIGKPFLLPAFQYFSPNFPFFQIPVHHALHPIIRHADSVKKVLNRVAYVFYIQKLLDIRMVNVQVSGECSAPYPPLGYGIHYGIKKLHETYRTAAFPVVRHGTAPLTKLPKITRGAATDLGLHNHLA